MEKIAEVVHEAVRAWDRCNDNDYYPEWRYAEKWLRDSTIASVVFFIQNAPVTAEEHHEYWVASKLKAGWTYGDVRDGEHKTHPLLLPFDELPQSEQKKDALIAAIICALTVPD